MSVALRMPPLTRSRSASQSSRVVRSTVIGTPARESAANSSAHDAVPPE